MKYLCLVYLEDEKLNALQGRNRTFYTGAAFHTHDSSLLWQFTEALLPRIAA